MIVVVLAVVSLAVLDAVLLRRRISHQVVTLRATVDVLARQLEQVGAANNGKARAILEQLPDYLVVHDREGRITYITPGAAELMNSTQERLIGTTYQERGDTQEGTATFHEFANLTRLSGKPQRGEISYQALGTDRRRRLVFHIAPLRTGNVITGTVAVFYDISTEYTSRFS